VGRHGAFKDRPLWRRLQTIHHEIKEGRHPNTRSLGELLSVSSKTVQRDIDYLRDELDAPIEFLRDENGYAYSRNDYVLPFLPVDGRTSSRSASPRRSWRCSAARRFRAR
jgi:predicted DNA-binding transcriptional regulator YafY